MRLSAGCALTGYLQNSEKRLRESGSGAKYLKDYGWRSVCRGAVGFMNKVNYQLELEKVLKGLPDMHRRLFLHSCCAPCSSYCLEYLRQYFEVTVFYYNPNISMPEEYRHRVEEQKRLIGELNAQADAASKAVREERRSAVDEMDAGNGQMVESRMPNRISFVEGPYEPERFYEIAKGLESCPEGGERCFACYELRLREAAQMAKAGGYDYFTTTLTISPLKNAQKLNEIGLRLAQEYGVAYLLSDFKKKGGYQRSIELSREYGLYRQDYCGCAFSKAEREGNLALRER